MKGSIGLWQLFGFAITSFIGTLLHFLYEWTSESVWISPFSGVNESTWEHMKLLFWPMFVFGLVQWVFFRDKKGFWCVKLRGMLIGLGLIPIIFYTYNGAIGKSPDWVNIAIFFISAAAAFIVEYRYFNKENISCKYSRMSFAILCIIGGLFIFFTFITPTLGIFQDPITKAYGI